MINPLSISTRGRITNSTKKVLTLATIGWLVISGDVIPNPSPNIVHSQPIERRSGADDVGGRYSKQVNDQLRRIEMDDDEIFNILKMWIKCQE